MVSLGYGCYTILSDALQLYIASGKRFIILARPQVSTLVLTKSIFASYMHSKHKVDSQTLPSFVVCHSAASVTRRSQMKELVHLVQLYK